MTPLPYPLGVSCIVALSLILVVAKSYRYDGYGKTPRLGRLGQVAQSIAQSLGARNRAFLKHAHGAGVSSCEYVCTTLVLISSLLARIFLCRVAR